MQPQFRSIKVTLVLAVVLVLALLNITGGLRVTPIAWNASVNAAPEPPTSTLSVQSLPSDSIPPKCFEAEKIRLVIANGYVAFVDSTPLNPQAIAWPETNFNDLVERYRKVIQDGYAGPMGLGDLDVWAREFGLARAPSECPKCQHAGGALRVMYVPGEINMVRWYENCGVKLPTIQHGELGPEVPTRGTLYHELAHLWDKAPYESRYGLLLETGMELQRSGGVIVQDVYQRSKRSHGDFATGYSMSSPSEHFADTARGYFLTNEYASGSLDSYELYEYQTHVGKCWVDEDPRCQPGTTYQFDRYDFVRILFEDAHE